jgi:hypothetical protein
MNIKIKVKPPIMPNFITAEGNAARPNTVIEVGSLSEEDAKAYAQLMYDSFIEHWKKLKERK